MKKPPPPFACSFTPSLPELFMNLNCTLVISTYQAGKVLFISAQNEENLIQLPRTFNNAMAIGVHKKDLYIAAKDEVVKLVNEPTLAPTYPNQPNTYDGLYVPRATYYTGHLDIHGLEQGNEGLWSVTTTFSCLSLINDKYSFVPKWKPKFISKLASEDKCHLNGIAMDKGEPLYVTALGDGDTNQSWRQKITNGGVLIHVPSNEIILKDLPMPHSPRLYDGKLYMVFSATGEILTVDTKKGKYEVIKKLNGFIRGMAKYDDYLFVGLSRLRKNSSTFKDLPIASKANSSGVTIIHLPTGGIVGELKYQNTVDEIFDVQILPGLQRPGILNTDNDVFKMALTTPNDTYWGQIKKEQ